ncbi:MAG: hypothetical protein WAN59_11855 [Candidatus Baltobacteraceae bacterium]|jgi:hypothetical protein
MNVSARRRFESALLGIVLLSLSPAAAGATGFAGTWSVSGTLGNPVVAKVSPVCTFAQSGVRLAGTCRGPNAAGPAAGTTNGRAISWTWRAAAQNAIGASGLATFQGTLGTDGVIRGMWKFSAEPRLIGSFTAIRP